MTTFRDAYQQADALLYKVVWWPEDWPLERTKAMTSYVCAMNAGEAAERLSINPCDIRSVTYINHVIQRPQTLAQPSEPE